MRTIPAMVDMKRTPKEKEEAAEQNMPIAANQPDYPYGLCICLCEDELEKLGLLDEEIEVGDMIHLHAMCVVKSVSSSDNEMSGPSRRVELQITHIAAEDEDEENEEAEKPERRSKLYG